jgi:predicted DCC family thiol-disulfide oxidoreductase YuxK
MKETASGNNKPVILYDGDCTLCNTGVRFILRHVSQDPFLFIPLSSEPGKKYVNRLDLPDPLPDSLILIEEDQAWWYSDAVLKIARYLRGGWPLFSLFSVFPVRWRDWVYRWIAKNRYHWFGKDRSCEIHNHRH